MAIVVNNGYWTTQTVKTLDQPLPKVDTFLTDTFFAGNVMHGEKRVRFEYMDMMISPAKYTLDSAPAELTKIFARGTAEIEIPRLTHAFPLDKRTLSERVVGESAWNSNMTINDRLNYYKPKISLILMSNFRSAIELQSAELLQTGKIKIIEYANGEIAKESEANFGSDIAVSVAKKWSDPTTDIFAEIEKYALDIKLSKPSHPTPNTLILGLDAYTEFIKHPKVVEKFDKLKLNYGTIDFSRIAPNESVIKVGAIPFGLAGKLEVLVYTGTYVSEYDENGNPKTVLPLIDRKKAIICNTNMGAKHHCPTITMNNNGTFDTNKKPLSFRTVIDSVAQAIRFEMESNTLVVPNNQTWRSLEVLA